MVSNRSHESLSKQVPSFGQLQRKHLLRSEIDNVENLLRVELPGKKIGKLKDELGGLIMKEFFAQRGKTYAYKLDNND